MKNGLELNLLGIDLKIDFEEMLTNGIMIGNALNPTHPALKGAVVANEVIKMNNKANNRKAIETKEEVEDDEDSSSNSKAEIASFINWLGEETE